MQPSVVGTNKACLTQKELSSFHFSILNEAVGYKNWFGELKVSYNEELVDRFRLWI